MAYRLPKDGQTYWRSPMNQRHVVLSASKAVLRARNALDDLHSYLLQLKGDVVPQGLQDTSAKAGYARELVRQIDAALTDPSLIFPSVETGQQGGQTDREATNHSPDSELAAEQPS